MRIEYLIRGLAFMLVLALVTSMAFIATPASAAGFVGTNYSGKVIEVIPGGIFVLRTELVWDEPDCGYYHIHVVWEDNNRADENFTVLYTRAFIDNDNDNLPGASPIWLENATILASGPGTNGTRWVFHVANTTVDSNDGYFDVEIYVQAASQGTPHRLWENHPISKAGWGGIVYYNESTVNSFSPTVTTVRVLNWTGSAVFKLENLYAVSIEKDLWLSQGSKLVVKFYNYDNTYENEVVIENFIPPWHVVENENVSHPTRPWCIKSAVKKAKLLLVDNADNEISKIKGWVTIRGDIWVELLREIMRWPYATPEERNALWKELMDKCMLWPYAPSTRDPGWVDP